MFLHADFLHSTERIKWRLEFFADWEIIWPINGKRLHGQKVHSLHSNLNDLIPAAIEWAQRHLSFCLKVSMMQLQYILTTQHVFFTHFFLRQSKDQECYSPCTWFLNMMPAEPGALIKYMRTQICTFCQSGGGFPTETRGWVSQTLNLKYKNKMKTSF